MGGVWLFSLHGALIFCWYYYYCNFTLVNKIVSGADLNRRKHNEPHVYRFLVLTPERCQLPLLTASLPCCIPNISKRDWSKYEMKSNNNSGNFSAPCRNITPVLDFCSTVFVLILFYVLIWFQPHRFLCPIDPLYYIKTLDPDDYKNNISWRESDDGLTLNIFVFIFLTWKEIWKISYFVCHFSMLDQSKKPTAVLFNTDEGNFFFSKKKKIIMIKKKDFRENVARIISDM